MTHEYVIVASATSSGLKLSPPSRRKRSALSSRVLGGQAFPRVFLWE